MNAVDQLRELFHHIAAFLVWPVLLGLLGLLAAILISVGAFLREAWDRRAGRHSGLERAQKALDEIAAKQAGEGLDLRLEEILQNTERERWRALGRLRLAVRVGPSLGLMGTLSRWPMRCKVWPTAICPRSPATWLRPSPRLSLA